MSMKFDKFNQSRAEQAEVSKRKRYNFTVTPIEDIAAYRVRRLAEENQLEITRAARQAAVRERAVSIIMEPYRAPVSVPTVAIPKPSLKERVASWCLKLLNDAFPS